MTKLSLYLIASTLLLADSTVGNQSPIIKTKGNVTINYNTNKKLKPIPILDVSLPRNNEEDGSTKILIDFFDNLQEFKDETIYIRFYTYVGAGIGIKYIKDNKKIKAGVIFDLKDNVDGFSGNLDNYEYGYQIKLSNYRHKWGGAKESIFLFPKKGNAFFDIHFMKSMRFEGLAKIKISEIQGYQWIEVIPVELYGNLKEQYDEIRTEMKDDAISHHEF